MPEKLLIEPFVLVKTLLGNLESRKIELPKAIESIIKLLESGQMTPQELLKSLNDIDQSSPTREDSLPITRILRSPQLEKYLKSKHPEFMVSFYHDRGFEEFHAFQVLVCNLNTFEIGKKLLQEALSDTNKFLELNPEPTKGNIDWGDYIQMTLCYINKDYQGFVKFGSRITLNKSVFEKLKQGWEKYGTANYPRDYHGVIRNRDILFMKE
jgi:hypothetical protein